MREATIEEQAAWRAKSVEHQLSSEKTMEFWDGRSKAERRAVFGDRELGTYDPDSYVHLMADPLLVLDPSDTEQPPQEGRC